MFGMGDPYQPGQGSDLMYGERLVGRVMGMEYNLAVQRQKGPETAQPMGVLAQMLGQFLQNRFSR